MKTCADAKCIISRLFSCVALGLLVSLVFSSSRLAADAPDAGLMWNRTGLPLVFPLAIESAEGSDYVVQLIDASTDEPALAAFIDGGARFQILVPPGTFVLSFWAGKTWENEEVFFGEEQTTRFALDTPLTFEITGPSTKKGYLVDIAQVDDAGTSEIAFEELRICQGMSAAPAPAPRPRTVTNVQRPSVGQTILERRFERGDNANQLYDRQRQQNNYDPPVLGAPSVPLARPSDKSVGSTAYRPGTPARGLGGRIKEWWC